MYKIECLEDITYCSELTGGYYFTPINYYYQYLTENIVPQVAELAKSLLLIKQLELCKKYGYAIDGFMLHFYLGLENNITDYYSIQTFLRNSKDNNDPNIKIQHLFTSEINATFNNLLKEIESDPEAGKKLLSHLTNELMEKYKCDINMLESTKCSDFVNYLIESKICIPAKDSSDVLKEIGIGDTEKEKRSYTKTKDNN